jgi:hypothetical protein
LPVTNKPSFEFGHRHVVQPAAGSDTSPDLVAVIVGIAQPDAAPLRRRLTKQAAAGGQYDGLGDGHGRFAGAVAADRRRRLAALECLP